MARQGELQQISKVTNLPAEIGMLAAVSEALYDLNRHRAADTLPEKILSVVTRLIPCDSAVFIRIEPATTSFSFLSRPADIFAGLNHKEIAELHLRDHPFITHFSVRRDARAWTLNDFVPRAVFQRSMLYRTLYRSLGIEFQLVLLVPYPDRAPRALVLNRRDSEFSASDRQHLQLLWPHFAQAVRNSRASSRQRSIPEIDAGVLGRGVMVLDRAGRVELCTEQARIWLTRYCLEGYSQREIRSLPDPIAGWVAQALANRLLHVRGIADPVEPLIVRRGNHYLVIKLITDHGRGQHLLLIEETFMNAPPDLLLGLGLTKREAEVLAWVAQGKTNRETGTILGLSTRTVQKHLEHVFAKLGVETRTAAILKAWQVGRFAALACEVI